MPYNNLITSDEGSVQYALFQFLRSTGLVHHLLSHQRSLKVKHRGLVKIPIFQEVANGH